MTSQFENNQLPNGNRVSNDRKMLPISVVDELAAEIAQEYGNEDFLRWYCGIIYQFGLSRVHEWRTRAAEGNEPAKLFSKYVKDARKPIRNWRTGE